MPYVFAEPRLGLQPIAAVETSRRHALGLIMTASDQSVGAGEFMYLQAPVNVPVCSWVTYNTDDGSVSLLGPDAIGPVAVAMATVPAGSFGWFQIQGKTIARAAAGFADNANVYATATPGVVGSTVVAGDRVKNAKGASAVGVPGAGLAEFEIARPFSDDGLAA